MGMEKKFTISTLAVIRAMPMSTGRSSAWRNSSQPIVVISTMDPGPDRVGDADRDRAQGQGQAMAKAVQAPMAQRRRLMTISATPSSPTFCRRLSASAGSGIFRSMQ